MNDPLYTLILIALTALAAFSLSTRTHKIASVVVIFWNIILFTTMSLMYSMAVIGSLAGVFFLLILSALSSFMFLVFYGLEEEKILLKLSTVVAAMAATNLLCIMTYIPIFRDAVWYYAPFFDIFYWYYGEQQIVLTVYMISLFWKSGCRGLYYGLNAGKRYVDNVFSMFGRSVCSDNVNNISVGRPFKADGKKIN